MTFWLLPWPPGVMPSSVVPTGGQHVYGETESITLKPQVSRAPTGLREDTFTFPRLDHRKARALIALQAGLRGSANTTVFRWSSRYEPQPYEFGLGLRAWDHRRWASGATWASGGLWRSAPPTATVAEAAAKGARRVVLNVSGWAGLDLRLGFQFGFVRHFGVYHCFRATAGAGSTAECLIDLDLRRAVVVGEPVTFRPLIAYRLRQGGAQLPEDHHGIEGGQLDLIEQLDETVRKYGAWA